MIESIDSKKTINIMALALGLSVLFWTGCFLPYMNISLLHVDCSVYILGAKTILYGAIPYKDFADHKPPGIYFIYALILKMFDSKNYTAINTFGLFFSIASTALIFFIVKKILNRFAGAVCAALYPLVSAVLMGRDAINPNTEIFMETFSLAGIYLVLIFLQGSRASLFFLPGMLFGIAGAVKQPSVFTFMAGFFGIILYGAFGRNYREPSKRMAYYICGFVSVWVFIALYFFMNGAFFDFWFYCFKFNFIYSAVIPKKFVIAGLFGSYRDFFVKYPYIFAPYFVVVCLYPVILYKERHTRYLYYSIFAIAWHLLDTAGVSVGGIFYPHYLIQWVPSLIVFMIIPFYYVLMKLEFFRKRIEIIVAIFVLILTGAILIGERTALEKEGAKHNFASPALTYINIKKYERIFGPDFLQYPYYYNPKKFYEIKNLVSIIRGYTPEDKPFFVFGFMPELYLIVDRRPSSRFVYTGFITGKFHALGNLMDIPGSKIVRYRRWLIGALLRDLERNPAQVIVADSSELRLKSADFFRSYLSGNYEKIESNLQVNLEIYVRKSVLNEKPN